MTKYKEIKGTQIEVVSSDPSNPVEGQVWYNSTDQAVKGLALTSADAWATGGNLNTGRGQTGGAGSGETNALAFGGETPGAETAVTEKYNGTSWTEVNDLNAATRLIASIGTTNTAALAAGGYQPPGYQVKNELWNGTNWTETTDLNSAKGAGGAAGVQTAGIAFAGVPGGPMATNEYWNGTNWTELNDLNTGRRNGGSSGILYTAALYWGGEDPSTTAVTELWNGTNWTEVNDLNTARSEMAGIGTSTAALAAGGFVLPGTRKAEVESWNGTNWTETTNIPAVTREYGMGDAGLTNTSGVVFGGNQAPGRVTTTYEFTAAGSSVTRTFTDS